jgi:hypothetical protein
VCVCVLRVSVLVLVCVWMRHCPRQESPTAGAFLSTSLAVSDCFSGSWSQCPCTHSGAHKATCAPRHHLHPPSHAHTHLAWVRSVNSLIKTNAALDKRAFIPFILVGPPRQRDTCSVRKRASISSRSPTLRAPPALHHTHHIRVRVCWTQLERGPVRPFAAQQCAARGNIIAPRDFRRRVRRAWGTQGHVLSRVSEKKIVI